MKKISLFLLLTFILGGCHTVKKGEFTFHQKEILQKINFKNKSDQYRVAPYDILSITIFNHPDLSVAQLMVKDDGSVTLPRIGKVKLEGLKLSKVEELLKEKYSKILKLPQIDVTPVKIVGSRYYLLGAVNNPGGYPLLNPVSILDAIGLAGGTSSDVSFYRWYIIRKSTIYPLNPRNVELLKKIYVNNGDTIIITRSTDLRVIVMGAVNKPGSYPLTTAHPTVWEAIAEAGGFSNDAWRSEIGILHWETGAVKIRVVSSFYPAGKNLQNLFIQPDDIIYVPTHPIGEWNRIISLLQPTINLFLVQPFGVVRDYYFIQELRRNTK